MRIVLGLVQRQVFSHLLKGNQGWYVPEFQAPCTIHAYKGDNQFVEFDPRNGPCEQLLKAAKDKPRAKSKTKAKAKSKAKAKAKSKARSKAKS